MRVLVGMGMGRLVIAALGELVIAATGGLVIAVLGALVITVLGAGHAGCSLWHGGLKKKKRKTCWDGRVRMDTETGEGWSST